LFLHSFCENILAYYINHLPNELESYPWLFRILSTLVPQHRINILRRVFDVKGEDIVVDKLSMAYVKNNQFKEGLNILNLALDKKYITKDSHTFLSGKIERLEARKDTIPIAQGLEESARNFSAVKKEVELNKSKINWPIEVYISIVGWILDDYKDRDWTDEEYKSHLQSSLRINFGIISVNK
ncbi:hypothetical protein HUN35_16210, partial [Acinetobacter bereziniae]